mmetsp:Transcript_37109/g.81547  ORF Transcript_37109/g.81547 Transcript_37109/m.81547 type:complete len:260 (+) Transcript_37109:570-1349(+)
MADTPAARDRPHLRRQDRPRERRLLNAGGGVCKRQERSHLPDRYSAVQVWTLGEPSQEPAREEHRLHGAPDQHRAAQVARARLNRDPRDAHDGRPAEQAARRQGDGRGRYNRGRHNRGRRGRGGRGGRGCCAADERRRRPQPRAAQPATTGEEGQGVDDAPGHGTLLQGATAAVPASDRWQRDELLVCGRAQDHLPNAAQHCRARRGAHRRLVRPGQRHLEDGRHRGGGLRQGVARALLHERHPQLARNAAADRFGAAV